MNKTSDAPSISICIPTYNGIPHIKDLLEELLKSSERDFEVVISDDGSSDKTWDYCQKLASSDSRLKCYRNTKNLGMDANFARTVSLADGDYIWFCGQDDKIFHQGVTAVLNLLKEKPELDFIFLNNEKVTEAKDEGISHKDMCKQGEHDVFGNGLEEFLRHNSHNLPTFLPKYILKRSLWESVDVTKYYGTYYCQVGVFLEVSKNLRWAHMDGNYVVGLTPENGWQSDSEQFTKISLGMYSMLFRASQKATWINENVLTSLVNKNYKRLIFSCLVVKSYHIPVNDRTMSEALEVIKHSLPLHYLILIIFKMPVWFCTSLLSLIKGRRKFRSRIMGITPQGPKIE